MTRSEKAIRHWLPAFSKGASVLVMGFGGVVLLGWTLGIPLLVQILPDPIAMSPLTACCFFLIGLSLLLIQRPEEMTRKSRVSIFVLGGLVALIGAVKLADYLFGFRLHIEQLLFAHRLVSGNFPLSEMAPNTAACLLLCGLSLMLIDVEVRDELRPAQALVLTAGLMALFALIGYGYRVVSLYRVGTSIPMSLETAVCFAAFSLGVLSARPDRGLMKIITSSTTGGAMARRLLPMALLVPWILGALLLAGEKVGYFEQAFGLSIFAGLSILIFSTLTFWNAKLLYLADLERVRAAKRLAVQHNVTRVLAEAQTLPDSIPRILQAIGETMGWKLAILWTPEPEANVIICRQFWSASDSGLSGFMESSRKLKLARGIGLPGRVWATGQPAWVSDVTKDANFPRATQAQETGFRAGFCFPIQLGPTVFGVIECFNNEVQTPDHALIEMFSALGTQIAQFIERSRAQEELRQASLNLERSNTDLQQFAYVASHDLSEPLRMVVSYLQLLADRNRGKMDKQSEEFIGIAIDGAIRMQALIKDLLAYSRLEVRGGGLEVIDLEQVFQAAVTNLKVAIEESGAQVVHQPLPKVRGDGVALTQVFQNLIGNAIKFRGKSIPRIEVGARPGDGQWTLFIRDNGIGIDPKFFERVFVIFQRLHTRSEYPGTGMGLAICKKIIERHGGRIWIESNPGQGATFFFTLSAEDKKRQG